MRKLLQLLKANAKADRQAIQAKTEGDAATILIYDVIDADFGVSASAFAKVIAGFAPDAAITLRINSPGGDVFEARAIATAIKQHAGKVTAHIDGLAASAATTIAAAADEVIIADGSFYMIHNAWTFAIGDKNDLTETAALLDKVDGAIRADYAARTGLTDAELVALMDAETWMTAQEAVDKKFADKLAETPKAKNSMRFDVSAYTNAPKALTETTEDATASDEEIAAQLARNERRLRLLTIE